MGSKSRCMTITCSIYFVWLGVQAVWLYFYVCAQTWPLPVSVLKRTHRGWSAYEVLMYISGWCLSMISIFSIYIIIGTLGRGYKDFRKPYRILWYTILALIAPICLGWSYLPFFGGWVLPMAASELAWEHDCNGYPLMVSLTSKLWNNGPDTLNIAEFYGRDSKTTLFSYVLKNITSDGKAASMTLHSWNVEQSSIPLDLYPTLQSMDFNTTEKTISGNCTVPTSSSNSTTVTRPCVTGTWDPSHSLFFNLTSSVPLNNTYDPSSITPTKSQLSNVDQNWTFGGSPFFIMYTVDQEDGKLNQMVIKSTPVKTSNCGAQRVCVAGLDGKPGGVVGAEVMAPLGVFWIQQAMYAIQCSIPRHINADD